MCCDRFFPALILLCFSTTVLAQRVTVADMESGEPLRSAALISAAPKAMVSTDEEGRADITEFIGSKSIVISHIGYRSMELSYAQIDSLVFQIDLEQTGLELEEFVISGTRTMQRSDRQPSRIDVIEPERIELQNPQTAADLLNVSGKVFIQKSQQGGGSPMIRGFSTNRLLYSVDGVRMNTAIFRSGNIQNVINLDPFALDRVEVLFGPGSVMYGSDAIGGVMSFQTLRPQLSSDKRVEVSGKALLRYATANQENTAHLDVNIGGKRWASVTSFSAWDFDHLRQGRNGPDDYLKPSFVQRQDSMDVVIGQDDELLQIPSAYSQKNFMQKFRFKPDSTWDLEYAFHFSETSPYGRYDRHNRLRGGLPRYAQWDYGPQRWMMNLLTIGHDRETSIYDRWTFRAAVQSFEESRITRDLNDAVQEEREERVDAYSLNLDLEKQIGRTHRLTYGVEYVLDDVSSAGSLMDINTGSMSDGPDRYPQADWESWGAYLNDEILLGERTALQAGLRYSIFRLDADFRDNQEFYPIPFESATVEDEALTGQLGAIYRPNERWVLKMNLATAFRSPNVDDIGKVFDSEPGAVVVPNQDLTAERAYSVDVDMARIFGEVFKLDISAYYILLDDAFVRRDFSLSGQDSIFYDGQLSQVQALQNAAQTTVYGIQAGFELELPGGFGWASDVNFQRGEEELDDGTTGPSRHAPPLFGQSRLSFKKDGLMLEFYALYQAEQSHDDLAISERSKEEIYALDAEGNTYAPSWYTFNIKASKRLTEVFTLTAGVENLTDQRYRPYSSGISGAGRNLLVSLMMQF